MKTGCWAGFRPAGMAHWAGGPLTHIGRNSTVAQRLGPASRLKRPTLPESASARQESGARRVYARGTTRESWGRGNGTDGETRAGGSLMGSSVGVAVGRWLSSAGGKALGRWPGRGAWGGPLHREAPECGIISARWGPAQPALRVGQSSAGHAAWGASAVERWWPATARQLSLVDGDDG
jgi:hypothetical protein